MKLLVDMGNSRIKWAGLCDGALSDGGSFVHENDPAAAATALLEQTVHAPTAVLVSNVAGEPFATEMANRVASNWSIRAEFAATQPSAGRLVNAYENHTTLGVDRWLAMLAATERYPDPVCVVDAGTAVTVDLVTSAGRHLGGYILPGLDLMRQCLTGGTGDLTRLTAGEQQSVGASVKPGQNTAAAIDHGALAAICELIECCVGRVAEHNRGIVVVTGGDAERIIPHLTVALEHRSQLVLEGLALWSPG
jgi:type III pantothenate kinase